MRISLRNSALPSPYVLGAKIQVRILARRNGSPRIVLGNDTNEPSALDSKGLPRATSSGRGLGDIFLSLLSTYLTTTDNKTSTTTLPVYLGTGLDY
jgi:hypothetical protein